MLAYKSLDISPLLYLLGGFTLIGIALQLLSNRVILIRIYQLMAMTMIVVVYLIGGVLFLIDNQPLCVKWLLPGMLIIITFGRGIFAFFRTRRIYTATMPHGPLGVLNSKTGVVDPTKSPPKLQRQLDKQAGKTNLVWRLIPLTSGLALAFVRGLSESGGELIMTIIAIVVVIGISGSVGSILAYIESTWRWEREHGKHIIVKR